MSFNAFGTCNLRGKNWERGGNRREECLYTMYTFLKIRLPVNKKKCFSAEKLVFWQCAFAVHSFLL